MGQVLLHGQDIVVQMFKRIKIHRINDHIWLMNDADEGTGYIVTGEEQALVIDTMNGYEDVKAVVESVTKLPLTVVNTHGHPDHIYGDIYFDEVYLHPDDWELAENYMDLPEFKRHIECMGKKIPPFLPAEHGKIFDLGGITLEVYHVPGHTPGGICLLDRQDRVLFTGDSVIEQTWMQMEESLSMHVFLDSLKSLKKIRGEFDYILTGHSRNALEDAVLCEEQRKAVEEVLEGKNEDDKPYEWYDGKDMAHSYGEEPRRIVYCAERVRQERYQDAEKIWKHRVLKGVTEIQTALANMLVFVIRQLKGGSDVYVEILTSKKTLYYNEIAGSGPAG